jgi:hypothetical protein
MERREELSLCSITFSLLYLPSVYVSAMIMMEFSEGKDRENAGNSCINGMMSYETIQNSIKFYTTITTVLDHCHHTIVPFFHGLPLYHTVYHIICFSSILVCNFLCVCEFLMTYLFVYLYKR